MYIFKMYVLRIYDKVSTIPESYNIKRNLLPPQHSHSVQYPQLSSIINSFLCLILEKN